ncbi:MAG TPA: Plug domain-containing protein [Chitinophaga sp.]|uniref:Plug domain-containing protein n=1 Tax=Chitinophaga sp. TaxID=1869181 RepID=UPI002DB656C3|nr:Plug domain-containing protein [Chitinophaga sp.]HEU4551976.1 Plug domain-containing protein [Chitinophaga sp.]
MMQKLLIALCFTTTFAYAQTPAPRADTTAAGTFTLGEVVVSGRQHQNINVVVSAAQLKAFAKNDVAKAINLLPSVNLSAVGPRNESMVYVRGFDLRQVPLLIDGIPVYIPYDGYVDLARFTFITDKRLSDPFLNQ